MAGDFLADEFGLVAVILVAVETKRLAGIGDYIDQIEHVFFLLVANGISGRAD